MGQDEWCHDDGSDNLLQLHNTEGGLVSRITLVILAVFRWPFFFSSRRRHTISLCDWSPDVCSSDRGRIWLPDETHQATDDPASTRLQWQGEEQDRKSVV